ncbi:MAG: P-II family nitrogen regulator [Planctomycetaceae bacterium]|nr:P-II family nitrogen regulator [Planctomycetaceae bacterium]
MNLEPGYELIITVVNKGWSDKVIKAGREAGAQGATILHARGSGLHHDFVSFLGIAIEPEKELVLNVVPGEKSERIVSAISEAINLTAPGTGITMVIPLRGVSGLFKPKESEQ